MSTLPFCPEATAPKRHKNADGSIEFVCTGCGMNVFCAVDDGFEFPVCMECCFFGEHPQLKRPVHHGR